MHSTLPGLWSYAASFEFERQGNVSAARRLLQTGLRNCGGSAELWLDYFRMELLFAKKLMERRKVLGLGLGAEEGGGKAGAEGAEAGENVAEGAMRDGEDLAAEEAGEAAEKAAPMSAKARGCFFFCLLFFSPRFHPALAALEHSIPHSRDVSPLSLCVFTHAHLSNQTRFTQHNRRRSNTS